MHATPAGLDLKRLRLWLAAFLVALSVPTGMLVYHAHTQLKWEAFQQHRVMAEELAARIDQRLAELVRAEEARAFTDYAFLVVAGNPPAGFVQRSTLSAFPVQSAIPGLIGYFQVDNDGTFSTPVLPPPDTSADAYGLSATELDARRALAARIEQVLSRNRLVQYAPGPAAFGGGRDASRAKRDTPQGARTAANSSLAMTAPSPPGAESAQARFDQLGAAPARQASEERAGAGLPGRVEDLQLDSGYHSKSAATAQRESTARAPAYERRSARKERGSLPEPVASGDEPSASEQDSGTAMRIHTFESEIDPLELSLLDSGHFVLFRKVWRDGQRYVQGMLIEPRAFLQGLFDAAFRATALSQTSDLIVAFRGNVLWAVAGDPLPRPDAPKGALLYRARLSAPMSDLELVFRVNRLLVGPGGVLITWLTAILVVVLSGGFLLMYRLGARQIELARQQQDFVSAVSHELKTPLTSIRMYGEMLRAGWASEEKRQTYYDYICDESERLSRLIGNVLQLARMTRNDRHVDLRPVTLAELMAAVRSRVASQVEHAGFALEWSCENTGDAVVRVDLDDFTQILINLVDNGVKFSAKAPQRRIDVHCECLDDTAVRVSVRDYGPGIPRDQMKKIFRLFYRSENALTRETIGTGIGLALVHQLALAMNARIEVVNREPGAEFRLDLPRMPVAAPFGPE